MYSLVLTGSIYGITPYRILVETDVSKGLPGFEIVGCPAGGIREARERIKVALKNTGITMPPLKITVNLSPADIRKEGTAFDLPIAIGILRAMELISEEAISDTVILGELGLDGEIRPVKGVLPIVLMAKENGLCKCILPRENAEEGGMVDGMQIAAVSKLKELLEYLHLPEEEKKKRLWKKPYAQTEQTLLPEADFADVSGQESVKRAAEIAAAGFHHLMIVGPPGVGKTMIAKRIPGILPPLTFEESLEVSKIYSVAGLLKEKGSLITKRPFLNPHHTISLQALSGGGRIPRPGVLSLAHKGVLFLDELPEFSKNTIEILRQPLEEKEIRISRAQGTFSYPADCILVAAMNPCPCGFYPDRNKCTCSPLQVKRYLGHISGPILDRMDLCVEAKRPDICQSSMPEKGESSETIRKRVLDARKMQQERFAGTAYAFNSQIPPGEISKYCTLGKAEQELMEQAVSNMNLSIRGYHRILRVARTVADLEKSPEIKTAHLTEAMCLRMAENRFRGV